MYKIVPKVLPVLVYDKEAIKKMMVNEILGVLGHENIRILPTVMLVKTVDVIVKEIVREKVVKELEVAQQFLEMETSENEKLATKLAELEQESSTMKEKCIAMEKGFDDRETILKETVAELKAKLVHERKEAECVLAFTKLTLSDSLGKETAQKLGSVSEVSEVRFQLATATVELTAAKADIEQLKAKDSTSMVELGKRKTQLVEIESDIKSHAATIKDQLEIVNRSTADTGGILAGAFTRGSTSKTLKFQRAQDGLRNGVLKLQASCKHESEVVTSLMALIQAGIDGRGRVEEVFSKCSELGVIARGNALRYATSLTNIIGIKDESGAPRSEKDVDDDVYKHIKGKAARM
jgi:hypothetical protein